MLKFFKICNSFFLFKIFFFDYGSFKVVNSLIYFLYCFFSDFFKLVSGVLYIEMDDLVFIREFEFDFICLSIGRFCVCRFIEI